MREVTSIDLNADLGEYQDEAGRICEREILKYVSSCNVACGGHVGDATTMRETLLSANAADVACGAHPSYPDREGFGRVSMEIDRGLLKTALKDQITALKIIARNNDVPLTHLKPHGALYNDAAVNPDLALLLVECMVYLGTETLLIGPPGSALAVMAKKHGIPFMAEGFVDRGYLSDGRLVPRGEEGSLIEMPEACAVQAEALATGRPVETMPDGVLLSLDVQTLCLHGDSPGATVTAKSVYAALVRANVKVTRARAGATG